MSTCPECGGKGTKFTRGYPHAACPICKGTGEVPDVELISTRQCRLEIADAIEQWNIKGKNADILIDETLDRFQANARAYQRQVDAGICEKVMGNRIFLSDATSHEICLALDEATEAIREGKNA